MTKLGPLIAAGRTSDVYEYGVGSVVKVPGPQVPAHWSAMEAQYTAAVRQLGAPSPDVRDLVEIDGRQAIVFERIDGESMWQLMLTAPADAPALSRELAAIHRQILSTGMPHGVPSVTDRTCGKIDEAEVLSADDREAAKQIVRDLPRGAALLHGDLHPGNVLMGRAGPVVIDWFDAAIGHPIADVVRTSLLIRPHFGGAEPPHLPGAPPELLDRLHRSYLAEMADLLDVPSEVVRRWESVRAAGRLAERAETDESWLVSLWKGRDERRSSPLVEALSSAGVVEQ